MAGRNTVRVTASDLGRSLRSLTKNERPKITKAVFQSAYWLVSEMVRNAPMNLGSLRNASTVGPSKQWYAAELGFNARHADVMDRGFKTKYIKPKKAKALYLPLTRAAIRRGPLHGALRNLSSSRGGKHAARLARRRKGGPGIIKTPRPTSRSSRVRNRSATQRAGQDYVFVRYIRTPPVRAALGPRGPNQYFSATIFSVRRDKSFERAMAGFVKSALRL